MDTAELLKRARARSDLTQADLARRSGTDPSVLSAYERGRRVPSVATLDRLLAACGLQVHAQLEPLHADLDRQIDELAALDPHARLRQAARWGQDVPEALAALVASGTPFAVTGPAAALLLGVPVPVARVDLTVRAGLEAARRVVAGFRTCRGAHLQLISRDEYAGALALYVAPEVIAAEGTTLWERPAGDRYRLVPVEHDPRPEALRVEVAGAAVPVLVPGASTGDPSLDRALQRWRSRHGGAACDRAGTASRTDGRA